MIMSGIIFGAPDLFTLLLYSLHFHIVVINLKFVNSPTTIWLLHSTRVWEELQVSTKVTYDELQNCKLYFVDAKTKMIIFDKDYVLNKTLEHIEPNEKGDHVLNLLVQVKGQPVLKLQTTTSTVMMIMFTLYFQQVKRHLYLVSEEWRRCFA